MKTVYVLKVRTSDNQIWSEPTYYRTRRERDKAEQLNRCLGGIRTWAYEEKKTAAEIAEIFEQSVESVT